MPLRDHFRPPVESRHSWDELHGGWPMMIVQQLYPQLPAGFVAVPSVHLGAAFEIDVSAYERDEVPPTTPIASRGGSAAVVEPPRPTLTVETELPDQDEYAVQIYDGRHGRRLVAAIELISPANKDRPESRRSFMAKAVTLLQRGVCVSLVDVVSIRQFNLYADIIDFAGGHDPAVEQGASCLYAATIRGRKQPNQRSVLESWYYPMQIGQPLPTLPLWLEVDLSVPLELEASYEETCRYLHID